MLKNKLCVCIHFVWATWDRQPLITEDTERDLYHAIRAICQDNKCEVLAVGGMPDHVHLLVMLSNTITLADLMKHVKGGSSRLFSQSLRPGEWFQWQGSYGAFSVGRRDVAKIVRYIQCQKQHHAEKSLWPEAENTGELFISALGEGRD